MKDHILMQIANVVSANVQKLKNPGLLEGKLGVAVFLYHYARYSGLTSYSLLSDYLLDEIMVPSLWMQRSFSNGSSGIGWGIKYLLKKGFVQADDDFLEELDNDIIRYIKENMDEIIPDCCLYLMFSNLGIMNIALMEVIAMQVSRFSTSGNHQLTTLNKLLALTAQMHPRYSNPLLNRLINLSLQAIDTKKFRHSDIIICKTISEIFTSKHENNAWDILYDKCLHILTIDDSQIEDCMETVWQNMVYWDNTDKVIHNMDCISAKVTKIIKNFCIQDMFFSNGLPAIGMVLLNPDFHVD